MQQHPTQQRTTSLIHNNYWETLSLSGMNQEEWESLCDRCGQCCLHTFENEEDGEIYTTNIACLLFDIQQCTCKNYSSRKIQVPGCKILSFNTIDPLQHFPETCAYRLLATGQTRHGGIP
jgi:uncharacterized protein